MQALTILHCSRYCQALGWNMTAFLQCTGIFPSRGPRKLLVNPTMKLLSACIMSSYGEGTAGSAVHSQIAKCLA